MKRILVILALLAVAVICTCCGAITASSFAQVVTPTVLAVGKASTAVGWFLTICTGLACLVIAVTPAVCLILAITYHNDRNWVRREGATAR